MVEIRLWAPDAARADALVDGRLVPMARADAEHFVLDLPAGTRYLLSVDGGEPRPDPRSRRQPLRVHGPSEVVDPAAFAWTDAAWQGIDILGKVFYELHVGTFTPEGTLDAARERLDHLVALGVDVVELMPLAPFPGTRGWGYDGVDLFAVHEPYGGPEALVRFVDAAHARGLGVCLDVVHNHFGPAGNYAGAFAPYLTDTKSTPWGDAVNLDADRAQGVRTFLIDNALAWLSDYHLDCLRLDAVHALLDDSPRHYLAELADAVAALSARVGLPKTLVAESDLNDPRMVTPTAEGGYGMDAQWNDDLHHALHAYLTGETLGYYADFGSPETLEKALTRVFVHDGGYSTFRGRLWGAPVPDALDRRRFAVFTQNHDQVGNRALGDRPEARAGLDVAAAGAAIVLLGPFTPLLFQGQEWGATGPFQFFTDHSDELGVLVRDGRRAEFDGHGWRDVYGPDLVVPDPQAVATFDVSRLDWAEAELPRHAALVDFHTALIRLRRESLGPGLPLATRHGDGWFELSHGPLRVVLSAADAPVSVPDAAGTPVAMWGTVERSGNVLRLGPRAVAVLRDWDPVAQDD